MSGDVVLTAPKHRGFQPPQTKVGQIRAAYRQDNNKASKMLKHALGNNPYLPRARDRESERALRVSKKQTRKIFSV